MHGIQHKVLHLFLYNDSLPDRPRSVAAAATGQSYQGCSLQPRSVLAPAAAAAAASLAQPANSAARFAAARQASRYLHPLPFCCMTCAPKSFLHGEGQMQSQFCTDVSDCSGCMLIYDYQSVVCKTPVRLLVSDGNGLLGGQNASCLLQPLPLLSLMSLIKTRHFKVLKPSAKLTPPPHLTQSHRCRKARRAICLCMAIRKCF